MFEESRSSSISGETAIDAPDELSSRLTNTSLGRSFQRLSNRISPEASSRPASNAPREVPNIPSRNITSKISTAAKSLWHTVWHPFEHSYSFGFDTKYPPRSFFYDVDLESSKLEKRDSSTAPWYLSGDAVSSRHMAHFKHEVPCTTVGRHSRSRFRGTKHTRRGRWKRPCPYDVTFQMEISVPYEASEPHTHITCKNLSEAAKRDRGLYKWLGWEGNGTTFDSKLGLESKYKKPINMNRSFHKTIEEPLEMTIWNEGKRVKDLTAHEFTVKGTTLITGKQSQYREPFSMWRIIKKTSRRFTSHSSAYDRG